MKILLRVLLVALVIWGLYSFFKDDEYLGFYYPDANNLMEDISSTVVFDSIDSCREWIDEQVSIFNPDGIGYDYECGKNCRLQNGQKPYICEETLQ